MIRQGCKLQMFVVLLGRAGLEPHMPRYFFHSEDGRLEHDAVGTELADTASARLEAVRFAGALLKDRAQALWEGTRWRLLVTDESALILFTVEVNTVIGAAVVPWSTPGAQAA